MTSGLIPPIGSFYFGGDQGRHLTRFNVYLHHILFLDLTDYRGNKETKVDQTF